MGVVGGPVGACPPHTQPCATGFFFNSNVLKSLKNALMDECTWSLGNVSVYSFKITSYWADSVLGAQTAGVEAVSLGPSLCRAGDRVTTRASTIGGVLAGQHSLSEGPALGGAGGTWVLLRQPINGRSSFPRGSGGDESGHGPALLARTAARKGVLAPTLESSRDRRTQGRRVSPAASRSSSWRGRWRLLTGEGTHEKKQD